MYRICRRRACKAWKETNRDSRLITKIINGAIHHPTSCRIWASVAIVRSSWVGSPALTSAASSIHRRNYHKYDNAETRNQPSVIPRKLPTLRSAPTGEDARPYIGIGYSFSTCRAIANRCTSLVPCSFNCIGALRVGLSVNCRTLALPHLLE